jgi:hypothetical protein
MPGGAAVSKVRYVLFFYEPMIPLFAKSILYKTKKRIRA